MKKFFDGFKKDPSEKKQGTPPSENPSQQNGKAQPASKKHPLSKLGSPPTDPPASPTTAKNEALSNVAPPYQRIRPQVPTIITEKYMNHNFIGLTDLLEYKEVQENTPDGLRVIEFVLDSPLFFDRWLGTNRMLSEFLAVFPEKQQQCVDNILRWKNTWDGFLDSQRTLYGFIDLCKKQRRQIIDFVFAHQELYSGFFIRPVIGEFLERMEQIDREDKLEGEESYRHKAMMILATQVDLYNHCIMSIEDFWEWQNDKKNEPYREAFFMHHITNDKSYREIFPYELEAVLEKFSHKKSEIFNFILSTPERFKCCFPCLLGIDSLTPNHETNDEQRQLRQRLFEYSLTIPGYEKVGIYMLEDLSKLYDKAPDFGQYVVGKLMADPEWLMKITRMSSQLKEFVSSDRYKPLKEVFLKALYGNQKTFTTRITDEADLKLYISHFPEEEGNLRHYYDLYASKAPNPSNW